MVSKAATAHCLSGCVLFARVALLLLLWVLRCASARPCLSSPPLPPPAKLAPRASSLLAIESTQQGLNLEQRRELGTGRCDGVTVHRSAGALGPGGGCFPARQQRRRGSEHTDNNGGEKRGGTTQGRHWAPSAQATGSDRCSKPVSRIQAPTQYWNNKHKERQWHYRKHSGNFVSHSQTAPSTSGRCSLSLESTLHSPYRLHFPRMYLSLTAASM